VWRLSSPVGYSSFHAVVMVIRQKNRTGSLTWLKHDWALGDVGETHALVWITQADRCSVQFLYLKPFCSSGSSDWRQVVCSSVVELWEFAASELVSDVDAFPLLLNFVELNMWFVKPVAGKRFRLYVYILTSEIRYSLFFFFAFYELFFLWGDTASGRWYYYKNSFKGSSDAKWCI